MNSMSGNNTAGKSEYGVQLIGLPWTATEKDICDFFHPLLPTSVEVHMLNNGRASGQADVMFDSFESREQALKMNKMKMGELGWLGMFVNVTQSVVRLNIGGPMVSFF